MNLEKLKDAARKHEQREDWRKAIEAYQRVIQHFDAGRDADADLTIYNRVGDLHLKLNDPGAAVVSYERAAELYAEQGFLNNAIALCGKILRVNPGRVQVYLQLAHLHARKNVVSEAKRNLIEYMERMNTLGKLDEAFSQVKSFADQHSANQDIRLMLVELLRAASRTEEAQEQLERIASELEARGDRAGARKTRERMHAIDATDESGDAASSNDLIFIDTGFEPHAGGQRGSGAAARPVEPEPVEGLETVGGDAAVPEAPHAPIEGLDTFEPPAGFDAGQLSDEFTIERTAEQGPESAVAPPDLELDPAFGAETSDLDQALEPPAVALGSEFADDFDVGPIELESRREDAADLVETEEVLLPAADAASGAGLGATASPALEPAETVDDSLLTQISELEDRILDDPDSAELHRTLGDRLSDAGDLGRAVEEYLLAITAFERDESWLPALDAVDALLGLEPDAIRHQQKRVELAYRSGDRSRLLAAYIGLAEALVRAEALDKAIAVYRRVLEHDPANSAAREALAWLETVRAPGESPAPAAAPPAAPPPPAVESRPPPVAARPAVPERRPAPSPGDDFVDLGSMVIDMGGPRDTRMRIDGERPTGDEQKDFQETLEQFKKGIEANLGTEDYEAHYDLGIAFKEMGLLDEAIAEFQKALRAPNGRLRTSEALGITFFEKDQHAIAETILRRAVDALEGGDEEKIGLLYWLGRACEAQGKQSDARQAYERALAVDIRFMDLGDRIRKLTAGRDS
jgi:tetratricopeptide (TPR) repeat protein